MNTDLTAKYIQQKCTLFSYLLCKFSRIGCRLFRGAVVAERLEPRTSIPEVPSSSPGPALAPLGKALYPHCLVFGRRLKAVGPVYRREIPYARKRTRFTSRKE